MGITPRSAETAELYFRDKDGMQELINKLSAVVQTDVDALKVNLDNQGGSTIDLEDLLKLLETDLKMSKEDAQKIVVELSDYSGDLDKNSEPGKDKIVSLLTSMIKGAKARPAVTHDEPAQKKIAGANQISKDITVHDADKAMDKSKNAFNLLTGSVESSRIGLTTLSDTLEHASGTLAESTSTSSGYMAGFSRVLGAGTSGLMAPFALLGGALAMAAVAIKGFQKKLDIGRSYGSAGGGNTMVEQLRQMHVTSLIDPAALNDLSNVMSKSFNVGLGMNQKEMTRVATKQRLSERVMGKEYANDQMAAINDMKTVLAGQSPSGMMDDLTAQTSALAKTMGVSNKYALEQIKAIHANSKAMTKGMSGSATKSIESTLQEMYAQNKAAGYTEEYNTEMGEFVKNTTTDKSAMSAELLKIIQLRSMDNEGTAFTNQALANEGISQDESATIVQNARIKGFGGLSTEDQQKMMKIIAANKQGQEVANAAVKDRIQRGVGTDKDVSQKLIMESAKFANSTETANKDPKEILEAKKTASEELKMNRASADAAPAVDKLLVAMQQQAGNSGKSKQELEAMLTANMMKDNPGKRAEIEDAKEKKIQFGMKKSKMGRTEYMASLGASQKEVLISKRAKEADMSRGDYLAKIQKEDPNAMATLEAEANTMAMNQLNFDSMTTVMGKSITESVGKMEKGVKGSGIAGVSASHLKAVVSNPDYENKRVELVSNPVEKAADKANRLLIEANNAMERSIMGVVNKAMPYLMAAMEFLADNFKKIAAGAIMLIGALLAVKVAMLAFAATKFAFKGFKLLGKIFSLNKVKKLDKGTSLVTRIFKKLGEGLNGIYKTFQKISKGFLTVAKAPFKIVKAMWDGGKAVYQGAKKLPEKARTLGTKIMDTKAKIGEKISNVRTNGSNVVANTKKSLLKIKNQPKITTIKNIGEGAKNLGTKITNAAGNGKKALANEAAKNAKHLARIAKVKEAARVAELAGDVNKAKKATALATKMQKAASITAKLAKATTVGSKAAVLGAGALGAAGSAFTKFLGPLGIAVTVAMAGKAAYDGWNNAGELLGLQAVKSEADAIKLGADLDENGNAMRNASGEFIDESGKVIRETASNGQKFSAALGGAVSSLTMGLIDASASAKWFDTNFGETWVHISKIWDNIVVGAKKLWDDTKAIFGPSMESLGEVFDDFVAMVISPFKAVIALFVGDTKGAKDALSEAFNGFTGLFDSIPKFLGDSFDAVLDTILELGDKIAWQFTKMMWGIADWWHDFSFEKEIIIPISKMLSVGWNALSEWVENIHFMELVIDPLVKTINDAISSMYISIVKHLPTTLTDYLGDDTKKKIKAAKAQDAYDEKHKSEIGKQKAISDGKTGEALLDQLAKYDLGDSDAGIGFTGGVKKEAISYLSDKQLKSLMKGDKNDDYDLDDKTKKLLQRAIINRKNGNTHQKTTVAGKLVSVGTTNKIDLMGATKNKDGLKTLKSYDSFKDKTSTEIKKFLKENKSELSRESRTKLIDMVDDKKRDSDRVKAAKEKTKVRKKERADKNKTRKNIKVKEGTDSEEIKSAKVAVGASGSDTIIQKAKDGLSAFGDTISSTFDSVMGTANKIATDGFGNVVAAIKGTNYNGGKALASNGPVMSNNTLANATVNKNMNMKVGALSAKYESRGSGTVSTGKGDKGGVSYGTYQMKSEGKNGGVVGKFMKTLPDNLKKAFQDSSGKQFKVNSPEFKKAWKDTAKGSNKKEFAEKQHSYIKKTHYDVQARKVKKETGVDLNKRSKAVQNVAWSTSVQHGGDTTVITKALEQLKKDGKKDTDENLIKAIYAERGKSAKKGGLARFGGSSAETNKSVKARYNKEEKDALSMLKTEEAMGKYVDPKTVAQEIPSNTKETVSAVTAVVAKDQISTVTPPNASSELSTFNSSTFDPVAFGKTFDSMMSKKNDDKSKQDYLKGITNAGEKQSEALYKTQQAMKQLLENADKNQDTAFSALGDEQKKRVREAYMLLKRQEKAQKDGEKTKNGNADSSNVSSTASAAKDATDETKERLVSQKEGSQMAKDLKSGLNDNQRKEAEAKMKELGIDMKWATDKAVSLGNGQTADSAVDMKKMEQVKNILALIKGTKTQKQVDLEQNHDKRMTNVGNTFADKKMEALKTEDLTGNTDYTKKRDELQKRLDEEKAKGAKGADQSVVAKIQAEQKALEATDGAKEDHKLDGKRKIKALIDSGDKEKARELTKEVYKDDYDTHMKREEKKYIGDIANEEQIAAGRYIPPAKKLKKTDKQIDLEMNYDKRMTNVGDTFISTKMEALKTEDLTGNDEYNTEKDKLNKKMEAAKKIGNPEDIAKIQAEQKALEATPGAKEDHKLDGKRKIKALIQEGKLKEAQTATKKEYNGGYLDTISTEHNKFITEVKVEEEKAKKNAIEQKKEKDTVLIPKKTVLSTAVKTDGPGAVEETPVTSVEDLEKAKQNKLNNAERQEKIAADMKSGTHTGPDTINQVGRDAMAKTQLEKAKKLQEEAQKLDDQIKAQKFKEIKTKTATVDPVKSSSSVSVTESIAQQPEKKVEKKEATRQQKFEALYKHSDKKRQESLKAKYGGLVEEMEYNDSQKASQSKIDAQTKDKDANLKTAEYNTKQAVKLRDEVKRGVKVGYRKKGALIGVGTNGAEYNTLDAQGARNKEYNAKKADKRAVEKTAKATEIQKSIDTEKAKMEAAKKAHDEKKALKHKTNVIATSTNNSPALIVTNTIKEEKKLKKTKLLNTDPLMVAKKQALVNKKQAYTKASKGTLVEEFDNQNTIKEKAKSDYREGLKKFKKGSPEREEYIKTGTAKAKKTIAEANQKRKEIMDNPEYKKQQDAINNSKGVLAANLTYDKSRVAVDEAQGPQGRWGKDDVARNKANLSSTTKKLAALPNTPEASKVRDMKNVKVQEARTAITAATKAAEASGGGIDAQEKMDLSKMESLLTQILNANTAQAKQATTQNALTKVSNEIKAKSHQMIVNKTGSN